MLSINLYFEKVTINRCVNDGNCYKYKICHLVCINEIGIPCCVICGNINKNKKTCQICCEQIYHGYVGPPCYYFDIEEKLREKCLQELTEIVQIIIWIS